MEPNETIERAVGESWEKINSELCNSGGVNPAPYRLGFLDGAYWREQQQWIPVVEKLPAIDQNVLCFYILKGKKESFNVTCIGHVNTITIGGNFKNVDWLSDEFKPIEPSHWQPLPKAPTQ